MEYHLSILIALCCLHPDSCLLLFVLVLLFMACRSVVSSFGKDFSLSFSPTLLHASNYLLLRRTPQYVWPIYIMIIYTYNTYSIYIYIALSVICPRASLLPGPKKHIFSASPIRSRSLRFEETIREQRSRRDSEKCIVQLTGAVTLLAEPYCIKHPRCGW